MVNGHKLSTKDEMPTIEKKKYRSMIVGFQYLTHTRPDIENEIGIVTIFQADPIETYYSSIVLCDIQSHFFLSQENNLPPRKKAPPLVLFLSSILPAQSASI